MKVEQLKPMNGWMLVKVEPKKMESKSGLQFTDSVTVDDNTYAKIIAIGEKFRLPNGDEVEFEEDYKVGVTLLVKGYSGDKLYFENEETKEREEYRMILKTDVLAIIEG